MCGDLARGAGSRSSWSFQGLNTCRGLSGPAASRAVKWSSADVTPGFYPTLRALLLRHGLVGRAAVVARDRGLALGPAFLGGARLRRILRPARALRLGLADQLRARLVLAVLRL